MTTDNDKDDLRRAMGARMTEDDLRRALTDDPPSTWGEPYNTLEITRPCPREGCDGTMIPEDRRGAPRVSFDWDGSGHIATACSRGCGMQSSATFTWDGFEGHHAEDEGEQAADEAQLTPRMRALLSEHGFGASFLAALTDKEEALLPVCPHEGTGTASEDEWKSGFAAGMEARA